MKYLPPIRLTDKYFVYTEAEIKRIFDELFYKPLALALNVPASRLMQIANSTDALIEAIKEGDVWHRDGHFYGSFNARITKSLREIGAIYNPRSKTWSLTATNVPADVRSAQATADSRFDALRTRLIRTIDDVRVDGIDRVSDIPGQIVDSIHRMEGDFQKTVSSITIVPELTAEQTGIIAAEWGQNLDKYIKKWTADNIIELRETVMASTFEGNRSAALISKIQQNYAVSREKAKFLARQETSLLMSKFRETRYTALGLETYRWGGSNDARERPDHRLLNGTIQRWDSKPITNQKTGARNHPGEDYGCRCVAIALVA